MDFENILQNHKLNDLVNHNNINEWSNDNENILLKIYETSQIYSILHFRCYNIFKKKYFCLTIPVIILSSLTGSANLALSSFQLSENDSKIFNLIIGILGIVITVISTLSNLFKYQIRKSEHYNYFKNWNKLSNLIETELSLTREKRNNCKIFFNIIQNELFNLNSNQPNIRTDVKNNFMKKYKRKNYNFELPLIVNLKKINIVVNEENIDRNNDEITNINDLQICNDSNDSSKSSNII